MSQTRRPCSREAGANLERCALWLRRSLIAAFLLFGFYLVRLQWPESWGVGPGDTVEGRGGHRSFWPGVPHPPVTAAGEAAIADDAEVIGVSVGAHARAYLLEALGWRPSLHVVNDVLGRRPVSVTYCPASGCSRVFTSGHTAAPLDLGVGGSPKDGMTLWVGGVEYDQKTDKNVTQPGGEPIPYVALPHVRTTWRAWRATHPSTDIDTGVSATHRLGTPRRGPQG
jgi:hypothetical protein